MIRHFAGEAPAAAVGRKAYNLSLMWRAGLPVPAGFSIPCDTAVIPQAELAAALERLNACAFAVRSSALNEDASAASFAGIFHSHLNVSGLETVLARVADVRQSAGAAAADKYAQRLNVARTARAGVIVQAFVHAEASGVLFTRESQSGAAHLVVEAAWGLGPAVADGLVRPDRWMLSGEGDLLSSQLSDKDVAVVAAPGGGVTEIAVDAPCRRRACLQHESLEQLAALARRCERLFGAPQDIEFAIQDGRVWLLQSRPITKW